MRSSTIKISVREILEKLEEPEKICNDILLYKMSHCTITCLVSFVIVVAMIIMTVMVSNDSFVKSYRDNLPEELQNVDLLLRFSRLL